MSFYKWGRCEQCGEGVCVHESEGIEYHRGVGDENNIYSRKIRCTICGTETVWRWRIVKGNRFDLGKETTLRERR